MWGGGGGIFHWKIWFLAMLNVLFWPCLMYELLLRALRWCAGSKYYCTRERNNEKGESELSKTVVSVCDPVL